MDKREIVLSILDSCEYMTLDYIIQQIEDNLDKLTKEDIVRIITYRNQFNKSLKIKE